MFTFLELFIFRTKTIAAKIAHMFDVFIVVLQMESDALKMLNRSSAPLMTTQPDFSLFLSFSIVCVCAASVLLSKIIQLFLFTVCFVYVQFRFCSQAHMTLFFVKLTMQRKLTLETYYFRLLLLYEWQMVEECERIKKIYLCITRTLNPNLFNLMSMHEMNLILNKLITQFLTIIYVHFSPQICAFPMYIFHLLLCISNITYQIRLIVSV